MMNETFIESAQKLTAPERREIMARLLAEQATEEFGTIWKSVRFDEKLRVVAYAAEQEKFVVDLRELLKNGALIRIENQSDGTCEIYGKERTFYATMSEKKGFVALLGSWLPNEPPREIFLTEIS
ncbi:MAG: hypothetical protein M3R14_00950 [Acidobacteriota bacterium]|nr:hypothetical protein [Acidobacteriota bacterium]